MPEQDYKRCGRCGEEKDCGEFNREKAAPDGLARWCKSCYSAYNKSRYTPKPRKRVPPEVQREKNRERCQRWYAANKERISKEEKAQRRATPRGTCKTCGRQIPSERRLDALYCSLACRDDHKRDAWTAVQVAVENGTIIRPDACESCEGQENIQAHHHDYSKPLDVEWLCPRCHSGRHRG